MAIYHLEAKVISRGAGRSVVAAAAYMSCSRIQNDYDGVTHDYTRKQGLVWQQIFLPEHAPPEWSDRSKLWNAVEENEKTKDSRLARAFVVALPIEMGKTQWQNFLTELIKENFVADGMCADVCIHDTDGHNPHAHIMVMEQQGFIADRCELNRQIKADNKLLRELRSIYEKIAKAVRNTVPAIAETLESLRRNMLIFRYQILHSKSNRRIIKGTLGVAEPVLRQYSDLVSQIKSLSRNRKKLLEEKKATSVLNILKHRELAKGIAQLSEDIEELRSEKAMILSRFEKTENEGMKEVKNWVTSMESSLQRLEQREAKYQAELDGALAQFRELTTEAENMDKAELHTQRQLLRKLYTQDAQSRLKEAHGNKYNIFTMMEAERDVDDLLLEEEKKPIPPMQEQPSNSQPELRKKPGNREYER